MFVKDSCKGANSACVCLGKDHNFRRAAGCRNVGKTAFDAMANDLEAGLECRLQ